MDDFGFVTVAPCIGSTNASAFSYEQLVFRRSQRRNHIRPINFRRLNIQ